MASNKRQSSKAKRVPAAPPEFIDPRHGDIEDDASSTKRRSMLSLFGSLLVEISLPKLIIAWILLLVLPGLLFGLAPIVFAGWLTVVADKLASLVLGLWSLLILACLLVVGWFGWRALFRMAEKNFWTLNSIVVEPSYASFREALRQLAEHLFARKASDARRAKLRAATAAIAGILVCLLALVMLWLAWPHTHLYGSFSEIELLEKSRGGGARQQRGCSRGLSRRRRLDLGLRRCPHGAAAHAPQIRRRRRRGAAFGASSISPTSMWSESATASAWRAAGRARAAMTACGAC